MSSYEDIRGMSSNEDIRPEHYVCDQCGQPFDPISTRWLCPHCHFKANCCEGAPLGVPSVE